MARHLEEDVVAYVECRRANLPSLIELAERVDRRAGAEPPVGGYGLGEAFSSIMNGGTELDIQAGLMLLKRWTFSPQRALTHD